MRHFTFCPRALALLAALLPLVFLPATAQLAGQLDLDVPRAPALEAPAGPAPGSSSSLGSLGNGALLAPAQLSGAAAGKSRHGRSLSSVESALGDRRSRDGGAPRASTGSALTLEAPVAPRPVEQHPERELLLAVEVCRHGDRAPLYEFPADALPASKWPEGVGELTSKGARAHYELGARMRRRYVNTGFLSFSWKPSEVYVRSTTLDRTLMSAASQMAGMFPPGTGSIDDVGTQFGAVAPKGDTTGLPGRWQPVPIHSRESKFDDLIPGAGCPRHAQLMEKKKKSSKWAERSEKEQGLFSTVAKIVGVRDQPLTLHSMNMINDVWRCYEAHGVPLPKGVTHSIRRKVEAVADWLLLFGNEGAEVRRLRSGLLLNDIKRRMLLAKHKRDGRLSATEEAKVKKFVLFSAHDTTVAAALAALSIKFETNPPYNSTLIFELFRNRKAGRSGSKYLVRVEFNGVAQHVSGCPRPSSNDDDFVCDLETYMEATSAVTIPSRQARARECKTGFSRHTAGISALFKSDAVDELDGGFQSAPGAGPSASLGSSSGWLFLLFVLVALSVVILLLYKARDKYVQYSLVEGQSDKEDDGSLSNRSAFGRREDRSILL